VIYSLTTIGRRRRLCYLARLTRDSFGHNIFSPCEVQQSKRSKLSKNPANPESVPRIGCLLKYRTEVTTCKDSPRIGSERLHAGTIHRKHEGLYTCHICYCLGRKLEYWLHNDSDSDSQRWRLPLFGLVAMLADMRRADLATQDRFIRLPSKHSGGRYTSDGKPLLRS